MTLFGNEVRTLRESLKITQRAVAEALGIGVPMYSRIERGERIIRKEQIYIIANTLGIDPQNLIKLWLADQISSVISGEEAVFNEVVDIARQGMHKSSKKKDNKIRLATVFSGIGAIEQALVKQNIPHEIMLACDNGERILKQREEEIRKQLVGKTEQEIAEYIDQLYEQTKKPNNQQTTYFANYTIDPGRWHNDIRFVNGSSLAGAVDLFVGGSPCQSFSSNGKRGGFDDTRGTLFYEYVRLVKEITPNVFIFENVSGLLVHDHKNTWKVIKSVFASLDYDIYINHDENGEELPYLDAQDYGVPQRRKRIFVVGIKKGLTKTQFKFPSKFPLKTKVADYLEPKVHAKYYLGEKGFKFVTSSPTRARIAGDVMGCQKANQQFNWNGDFIFEPLEQVKDRPDVLKKAYVSTLNGREGVIRKFTPRECLRLMGYPDSFKIVMPDTEMYRQCGNSIVVNVLEEIVKELYNCGALK